VVETKEEDLSDSGSLKSLNRINLVHVPFQSDCSFLFQRSAVLSEQDWTSIQTVYFESDFIDRIYSKST